MVVWESDKCLRLHFLPFWLQRQALSLSRTVYWQSATTTLTDDVSFCSSLAVYFDNKIRNIKSAITSALVGQQFEPLESDQLFGGMSMSDFRPVTAIEVEVLIKLMSSKSSPLDFIPTSLIKQCGGTFAPIIVRLANLSLQPAVFPSKFKVAQVTPILKKHGLHMNDPVNHRPISNLNTISKVFERLVLTRIVPHVSSSPNFDESLQVSNVAIQPSTNIKPTENIILRKQLCSDYRRHLRTFRRPQVNHISRTRSVSSIRLHRSPNTDP